MEISSNAVTFIGAGVMGLPMIRNLIKGGIPVRVFDVRQDVRDALRAEGIDVVTTLAEATRLKTTVITMLPDTPDVRSVVLGAGGLAELLPAGSLFIDMSSISPAAEQEMGAILAARNVRMVDAPVSGGVVGAVNAALSIMVGGSEEAFALAQPYLRLMGSSVLHVGSLGTGQVFKLCNQLMVASHIQAMCEAFALGRAHGVDLELMSEVLRGGAAGSWMLDNLGPKVLAKDDSAGFRIDLQLKDLKLANDAALQKGVPLPGLALTTALYLEAKAHGEGTNGNQALFRTFDRLANQHT